MGIESGPPPTEQENLEVPKTEIDREERAERLLCFLDKLHAEQVFDNCEHKQEFVSNLEFKDFTNLLLHVNGIVRDIPKDERALYEDVHFEASDLGRAFGQSNIDTTRAVDKPRLLEFAFNNAKTLEDPRDIGLVTAASINAIHVFSDGNGRTSRLIYDLFNYNYTGSERDKQFLLAALDEEGRSVTPDVNTQELLRLTIDGLIEEEGYTKLDDNDYYFYQDFLADGNAHQPSIDNLRPDLSEDQRQRLTKVLSNRDDKDSQVAFLSLSRVLSSNNRLKEFIFKKVDPELKRTPLSSREFVKGVTPEEVDQVWETYWQIQAEVVQSAISHLVENRPFTRMQFSTLQSYQPEQELPREILRADIQQNLDRNRSYKDLEEIWPEYPEETT